MKRALLLLAWLFLPAGAFAADWPAADCSQAAIMAVHDADTTVDGDRIILPACAETDADAQWSATMRTTKGVMIQGQPCTLGTINGIADLPVTCPTNIRDAVLGDSDLSIMFIPPCDHPCAYTTGFANISFTSTGQRSYANCAIFCTIPGSPLVNDGRRLKMSHLKLQGLTGQALVIIKTSEAGVIDHIDLSIGGGNQIFMYNSTGGAGLGDGSRYDERWAAPVGFGNEDWLFIENSNLVRPGIYPFALTDGHSSAGKFVVRNSKLTCGSVQQHGTEQGWYRGNRGLEFYRNVFVPCTVGNDATMGYTRSGGLMAWGNGTDGDFQAGTPVAHMVNYRHRGQRNAWEEVTGAEPIDVNYPMNPLISRTSTSAANLEVTSADAGWTPDAFIGQVLKKNNCVPATLFPCVALITDNDEDTITFATGQFCCGGGGDNLTFAADGGDTFEVNQVTHTLDQPCRGEGAFAGTARTITAITMSGTLATLTSSSEHDLSTGDWVSVENPYYAENGDRYYTGLYQVTVLNPTQFTYTPKNTPLGNSGGGGYIKKVTDASGGGINQVTEGCYEWLNTDGATSIHLENKPYVGTIRDNEHFYNYVGSTNNPDCNNLVGTDYQCAFTGTSGVGVGLLADRPTSCTAGVVYWATDQGDWDSVQAGADGQAYKCVGPDTWSLFYVPYAFPHPRAGETIAAPVPYRR